MTCCRFVAFAKSAIDCNHIWAQLDTVTAVRGSYPKRVSITEFQKPRPSRTLRVTMRRVEAWRVERPLLDVNLSRFSWCHFCNFFNNIFVFRFHSRKTTTTRSYIASKKWQLKLLTSGTRIRMGNWNLQLGLGIAGCGCGCGYDSSMKLFLIRDKGHLRIEELTVGAKALGSSEDWRESKTVDEAYCKTCLLRRL